MVRVTDDELFDTNVHVRGIGNTALHIAAGRGDLAMVRILATAPDAIMNLRNNRGQTPLHYAAGNGHADVIWFLRMLPDVDVNAVDAHGSTPLHYAAARGHYDAVVALCESSIPDASLHAILAIDA